MCVARDALGNVRWMLDSTRGGKSCVQVCADEVSSGSKCIQSRLDALQGSADGPTFAAYAASGYNCSNSKLRRDCEANKKCDSFGSPYVHNSHGGRCYGGSKPDIAPCAQIASDMNHRRLCPCQGMSTSWQCNEPYERRGGRRPPVWSISLV